MILFTLYIFDAPSTDHTYEYKVKHAYLHIRAHTKIYTYKSTYKVTMRWARFVRASRYVQTLRYRPIKLDYRSCYQVPKKIYRDTIICDQHRCDNNVHVTFSIHVLYFLRQGETAQPYPKTHTHTHTYTHTHIRGKKEKHSFTCPCIIALF